MGMEVYNEQVVQCFCNMIKSEMDCCPGTSQRLSSVAAQHVSAWMNVI